MQSKKRDPMITNKMVQNPVIQTNCHIFKSIIIMTLQNPLLNFDVEIINGGHLQLWLQFRGF